MYIYVESIFLNRIIIKRGTEGKRRWRLAKKLKPMPTIFYLEESNLSVEFKHLKLPVSVPRKSPTKRVYQQDHFKLFEEQDKIKSFDDINSTWTPPRYTFWKNDDLVVFYRLETVLNVTEVLDCVRVDWDLNVKLFFKGSPLYLPQGSHHRRDCQLTEKSMM